MEILIHNSSQLTELANKQTKITEAIKYSTTFYQLELTNIWKKLQDSLSFQVNYGTLTKTNPIVGHKASLKFQFCKLCSLTRIEVNTVSYSMLRNFQIHHGTLEQITIEIRKYFNWMIVKIMYKIHGVSNIMIREKNFKTQNAYITKNSKNQWLFQL